MILFALFLVQHRGSFAIGRVYGLVPRPMLFPMVALATTAAVIASQAMISGVFSQTQQAIQLGYLPRMRIVHKSEETRGRKRLFVFLSRNFQTPMVYFSLSPERVIELGREVEI